MKMEVSLFEPVGTDKEGKQIHLMEVLLVDDVDVSTKMEIHRDIDIIMRHIDSVLTDREKEIIKKRYGLFGENEYTQREIASVLGISRSYVSRIEKRALEKLKKLLNLLKKNKKIAKNLLFYLCQNKKAKLNFC